jgi:cytochrome c553
MKRILIASLAATLLASIAFAADINAGAAKAKEVCAACHGMHGKSTDPNNPHLAGQWRDYLEKALRDYKSGARNNAIMSGFAKALSKQDIENLAAYYASQKPVLSAKY